MRQLEALIRLSEAMAKMTLSQEVSEQHVFEAHNLFQVSTLNFASFDGSKGAESGDVQELVERIETFVLKRIAVGGRANSHKLIEELQIKFTGNNLAVSIAVNNLVKKGDLVKEHNGKVLCRK